MLARSFSARRRERFSADHRPKWFDIPEEPDLDDEPDYDRLGMMMKIDTLDRGWRDLINEHGFAATIRLMYEVGDLKAAARCLDARRQSRQQQIANGSFEHGPAEIF